MTSDEDRVKIARLDSDLAAFTDVPSLTHEGGEIVRQIESRLKELSQEMRTKIEPMARRAYTAAREVIAAPDEEPGARPNKAALARMIAWFAAEDQEPKTE